MIVALMLSALAVTPEFDADAICAGKVLTGPAEDILRGAHLRVLEMKRDAVFRGVHVVAISPFRLPSLHALSSSTGGGGPSSATEFKGWQLLTKPVGAQPLDLDIIQLTAQFVASNSKSRCTSSANSYASADSPPSHPNEPWLHASS